MATSDYVVVILAAGKGTRLKSALAKVLHRAGGRTLIEHVVRACQPLKAREMIAVVGHQAEDVTAAVAPLGVKAALQQPQRGTGHAMLVARRAIPSRVKFAILLPGDAPLIRTETLAALTRAHRESGAAATILSAEIENPAGYGRIVRRDGGRLEENARVGNFVEVKKSVLGEGVKSMHLTYLGDARVGAGTNIGAGTITCNYDGVNKNSTTIGKRVFIGSDTALVAPVRVGDGAYVGAGSVITENVPADALALARGRQVNMAGWASSRRREMAAAAKAAKSRPRKKSKRRAPARRGKAKSRRAKPRKSSRRR